MTTTPIPDDIMQAAREALNEIHSKYWDDYDEVVDVIERAIMAERQRCANSTWDFWYGIHRGNISIEDMASFLKAGFKQMDKPA